ncbi:MAG: 50S ribosomal protein L9 [Chloroflexia bacterium]
MKVILTQAVPGVGEAGTIKEVADGYARNYLLPKKLAVVATRGSVKQAEAQADLYVRRANKALDAQRGAAAAIQDKTVTIRARAGSENRLYGSVTPADIAEALQAQHNLTVDRRKIELSEAIHRLGTYTATADIGNGITAQFNVEVAPEVAAGAAGTGTGTGSGKAARASASGPAESIAPAPAPQDAAAQSHDEPSTPADDTMDAGRDALIEARAEFAEQQAEAEDEAESYPS